MLVLTYYTLQKDLLYTISLYVWMNVAIQTYGMGFPLLWFYEVLCEKWIVSK